MRCLLVASLCFFNILECMDAASMAARAKAKGSAVQKIIEMLGDMKTKLKADLEEETKDMNEFMAFCDDEAKEKAYAIKGANRALENLKATIANSNAKFSELSDEITTLGTEISAKEKELAGATKIRDTEHADFVVTEKELAKSADEVSRALTEVKKNQAALMQLPASRRQASMRRVEAYTKALSTVVESALLTGHQRHSLRNFMQMASNDRDESESDLSLSNAESFFARQPQPKGYESATGGIVDILEETKDKAENELADCRKAEMEASQKYEMLKGSLENEIGNKKKKLADATTGKAAAEEAKGKAESEKVDTEKANAADNEYLESLKSDCQAKAVEWEERLKSAKGEMGALDKAKEILSSGVKAFIQVSTKRVSSRARLQEDSDDEEDESNADSNMRQRLIDRLMDMQNDHHSFALSQLASRIKSGDPFAKIKGLIEEMLAKLMDELNKEVGQKAFCDQEMGKSKKALEEKTLKLNKYKTRLDEAETRKMELSEAVKELEAEMGEIDKAQAEATKIRTKEHADFKKAQADNKSAEDACAQAIEVLKEYYGGESFIQMKVRTHLKSEEEDADEEQSSSSNDSGKMIVSFLETAQSDFAALLAEVEATENAAKKAYDSLTTENKVAKASKGAESKAKQSEIKMLSSSIEDSSDDHAEVSKELDAVNAYIDKLKPECESKAMSAQEKIAARKQEIEGLKDALSILSGAGAAFLQTSHRIHRVHLHV